MAGLVVLGTLVVMALPLLNGGPFFYFDTSAYIEQAAKAFDVLFSHALNPQTAASAPKTFGVPQNDKVVLGGRSIYYGIFAYAGWVTSMWLPVVVQSLTLSWLVVLLFRCLDIPRWGLKALSTLALLALLSSASVFAGLVMPDIWAGLLILALALLWTGGLRLTRGQKGMLLAILSFAGLVHNSHIALLAAMIGLLALVRLLSAPRDQLSLHGFALPLLALGIGIAGNFAYAKAVRSVYGAHLLQRPFITAHLTEMGPGTRLIRQTCPKSAFALCDFADRLPVGWISFLFSTDPDTGVFAVASPAVQKALAAEQIDFAWRTLKAEPVAVVAGLARDGVSQLWTLSMKDVGFSRRNERYITSNFPVDLGDWLKHTRIYGHRELADTLLGIVQITSALSVLVLVFWAVQRIGSRAVRHDKAQMMDSIVLILVTGVVVNALICGILASPYGRFQARIIWILPLAAVLVSIKYPIKAFRENQ